MKPSQILAVGRNYAAHAAELGNLVPDSDAPLLFWKPVGCVAEGGSCALPQWSEGETSVHYEGEIVLFLNRAIGPGTEPLPEDALEVVACVAAGLDLSDRELQKREPQWVRAKGFADACALGLPSLMDRSAPLRVRTWLNGELVQDGTSDLMLFPMAGLIRYVHGFLRLNAGDAIFTGTPAGVGPVKPGDTVRVAVGTGPHEHSVLEVGITQGQPAPAFPR